MSPHRPRWLERWLQRDDDALLYVDQTILLPSGLTLEEQCRVVQAQDAQEAQEAQEAQDSQTAPAVELWETYTL